MMLEVERKFRVSEATDLTRRLREAGAQPGPIECHGDTYYRHPCRDFVRTGEAFRVRRINDVASVTYKGPKLAVDDEALKAREEIEWCLAPEDADGNKMERLLVSLGFEAVTTVRKNRISHRWTEGHEWAAVTVTLDDVEQVGSFAEIELLVDDSEADALTHAAEQIERLAGQLDLRDRIRESYLELLLAQLGQ
ncbi:MAG: class IV adenylate cyclase [Planctomycetota bacterium]